MSIPSVFMIALGGALGALSRWKLDLYLRHIIARIVKAQRNEKRAGTAPVSCPSVLPFLGIGIVNICGSFLLGIALCLLGPGWELSYALLVPGFLGAFTTFSTAMMDCWTLWHAQRHGSALALCCGVWALSLLAFSVASALVGLFL